MSENKLDVLTNKEISCMYYMMKSHLEDMNESLNKKELARMETLDVSEEIVAKVVQVRMISDAEVSSVKNSDYYKTIESITQKFKPIVEMIEESEPSIKKELNL